VGLDQPHDTGKPVHEVQDLYRPRCSLGDRAFPKFKMCQVIEGESEMVRQPGLRPSQLSPYCPQFLARYDAPSTRRLDQNNMLHRGSPRVCWARHRPSSTNTTNPCLPPFIVLLRKQPKVLHSIHHIVLNCWKRISGSTGTEINGRDIMGKRPLYRLIDFAASERESYQKGYRKSARLRL
jgi:hypothetical protein